MPDTDDEAKALRKQKARERGYWLFFLIFSLPVLIGLYLVWRSQRAIHAEQAWAQAELAKPRPDPQAYGVRGAGLLAEGKPLDALPLLQKAAATEAAGGPELGAKAQMMYIEAMLVAREQDPTRPQAPILIELLKLEQRAAKLAQGQQAAAWHAAGKLYGHLDAKADAIRCLKKAVELQPDDWVQNADGTRYKYRGVASIYEKDLAAATLN
jgi:hypothetical protein